MSGEPWRDLLCCLPHVSTPAELGYDTIFRVIIMQFIDAHSFDLRSVKKSCVHIVHSDGRLIPFDTYNLFYRDGLEASRLAPRRAGRAGSRSELTLLPRRPLWHDGTMAPVHRAAAAVFVLALGVGSPQSAFAQTREGFWFGIGVGAGQADVTCDDCAGSTTENGGSGYAKAGFTLNPHVLVGGELNVWTRRKDFDGTNAWFTMYNASATLTVYPSATAGFFVKGGAGVAYLDTDIERRNSTFTIDLGSGAGFLVGAGYDIRMGKLALTPAVNYWFGNIGDLNSRGDRIATGWTQHVVDVTIGVTFP